MRLCVVFSLAFAIAGVQGTSPYCLGMTQDVDWCW